MTLAKRAKLAKVRTGRNTLAETRRRRDQKEKRSSSPLTSAPLRLRERSSCPIFLGEFGVLGEILFSGGQCAHAVVTAANQKNTR
jgi:hypothetical protein